MTRIPSSSWFYIGSLSPAFVRRLLCLTSLLIHTLELTGERSERVHFLQGPVDKSYSVTLRFEEARDPESINCSRSLSAFDQISLWNALSAYHLVTRIQAYDRLLAADLPIM